VEWDIHYKSYSYSDVQVGPLKKHEIDS